MSGLRLCTKTVSKPYYIEELNINLYSVEEMAYYLYNNVYLVNREFFDERLTEYIREEYNMPELAEQIEKGLKFGDTYAELVMMVVKASGYYDKDEIDELQYILEKIGNKSVDERMILRAELLMKKGKYSKAHDILKKIMKKNSRRVNTELMPGVWESLGMICVRRFDYNSAAECFEKSIEFDMKEDVAEKLVMTYILSDRMDDAAKTAQKAGISDENFERIRIRIKECREEIKSDEEYRKLSDTVKYNGSTNIEEFYAGVNGVINTWKQEYREEMA